MKPPTPEQQAVVDAYQTGDNLVVEAGAGTGKTTTLKMVAAARPARRGLYVAYNKAIATDAQRTFPDRVKCSTAHSLAYGAVGRLYRHRLNGPRVPARETALILRINEPVKLGDRYLAPQQLARLTMETVDRFCKSADTVPTGYHVPRKPRMDDPASMQELRSILVPYAQRAWEDLTSTDGRLRFDHGVYLKMWQLSRPRLPYDYVMLDEAQDANPVIASVVDGQTHTQRIMVGDRSQAIYGWNGAIDAMAKFDGKRLLLSQSFRFGPQVAREANKWLTVLGADLRLTGFEQISSQIAKLAVPDAVLCRSNAGAMSRAIQRMRDGHRVALVGGGDTIRRLAEAAVKLKAGLGCDHPELFAFRTWAEVQDYAENDPAGGDLKVFVKLIDDHGPDEVIDAVTRLTDERYADIVLSTSHKAKGREWDSVQIATDFHKPKDDEKTGKPGEIAREEAMLAYVAVTRAKLTLDRTGLAWVDDYAQS